MTDRIIKFRAWDGMKMYLPEYSDKEDFHILPDGTIVETHEHGYERHEITSFRGDSWVLMQFTGLLDKNGVEIYESDRIYHSRHDKEFTVSWNQDGCGWNLGEMALSKLCVPNLQVVGNIYEQASAEQERS